MSKELFVLKISSWKMCTTARDDRFTSNQLFDKKLDKLRVDTRLVEVFSMIERHFKTQSFELFWVV